MTDVVYAYILTIYQIMIDEYEPIHVVSYIKKHEITNCYKDNAFLFLKDTNPKLYEILNSHIQPLYNDITEKYETFKKCPVVEIYRHICDSLDTAKQMCEKMCKISRQYTQRKYTCYKCKFYTDDEYNWIKHQISKIHSERITTTKKMFNCENCEKSFLSRSCFWKHKKICVEVKNKSEFDVEHHMIIADEDEHPVTHTSTESAFKQEILNEVTAIVQEKIIEMSKPTSNTHINSHNNTTNNNNCNNTNITNNNHFNLNFFLNETCKNAITIKEFVDNIHVGIDTVEYTGRNGYVAGISKIITDELRKLGCEMRPIHCTDLKRETIYIKDEEGWEKDNEEKEMLNNTIRSVARKNMRQINQWRLENPECEVNDSEEYNFEICIMKECNGGDSEKTEHKRICNQIAKLVYVDKG